MARTTKAPKKRAASTKKSTKAAATRWRNPRVVLFALLFAALGVFALLQINASPALPQYSDDIVAGYLNLTPVLISEDESGNRAYEMYPASTYVQVDGTVVCDTGGVTGTVTTGTLSKGEVKKLQKDVLATGVTDLADEIGTSGQDAFVSMEGFMVAEGTEAKGSAVYPSGQKPSAFTKAQATLQKACDKANRTTERAAVKAPREPKLKKTSKKSAFNMITGSLFAKVSACCSDGVTEDKNFEYAHYNSINAHRQRNGRRTLPHDQCAGDKATIWSNQMAVAGRISHSSNIASDANNCRRGWRRLGENVGVGYDNTGLMNAFKASHTHNVNMLDSRWTQMGIGAVWVQEGSSRKYYVTQRYAQY